MVVYGVSHSRSRELYDLTMLEVRRVLYPDVSRRRQIAPGRLLGTKLVWMTQYAPLMNQDEFTKFTTLMRNLSPFVLYLIDLESCSRRQDRNPPITRQNLLWVIHGHPDAVPLFKE